MRKNLKFECSEVGGGGWQRGKIGGWKVQNKVVHTEGEREKDVKKYLLGLATSKGDIGRCVR